MSESPQRGPSFPAGRFASLPFHVQVKLSKRSWWEVAFLGGETLGEWETAGSRLALPVTWLSPRSKWEEIDHSRIRAARLWTPDGRNAEVEPTGPYRTFQFKVATASILGHEVQAHVLGVLTDGEGGCAAWEWLPQVGALRQFQSNVLQMHERWKVGPFNLEVIGVRL